MQLYTSDGRSYTGMEQETVQGLLDEMGLIVSFIAKEEYDIFLAANQPTRPSPTAGDLQSIADAKNTLLAVEDRLNALLFVLRV